MPSLAIVATLVAATIVFLALFHLIWPITLDNTNVNPFYLSKKESPNLEKRLKSLFEPKAEDLTQKQSLKGLRKRSKE